MHEKQSNPFGRRAHEIPEASELLEGFKTRVIPHDHAAENTVVGYALQDSEWLRHNFHQINLEMFHSEAARIIMRAAMDLLVEEQLMDAVIVTARLKAEGNLDLVGGPAGVMEMFGNITHRAFADRHLSDLRELMKQRRQIHAYARGLDVLLSTNLAHPDQSLTTAVETARGILEEAAHTPGQLLKSRQIKEIIPEVYDAIQERVQNPGKLPGFTTGIAAIDKRTGGLQKGHVWVIAGAPGDGKSTLMQNCAEGAAEAGAKVRWYPLEMPDTEQVFRLLSSGAKVDNEALFSGAMTRHDIDALQAAQMRLSSYGIELVDVDGATATDIFADIERSLCDIVVVDYLQLLEEAPSKNTSREQILSSISRRMKLLANRTGKTILTGSQLNDFGQLRESRAIGQNADKVLVINKHPLEGGDKDETDDSMRLLWGEKNRGGRRHWELPLRFLGNIFQFREHF